MEIIILRFDAPLMSFGAPMVDNRGVIQPYPALSMMTGLVGNALGYDHAESGALEALQQRIRYAVRQDRRGERIRDYQTVDLSRSYMDDHRAWTTRGSLETRKGGSASSGTHIRLRDYWAGGIYTVALTLDPSEGDPGLEAVRDALRKPERPLFIGRKTCLPAGPLFVKQTQIEAPAAGEGLVRALANRALTPLADRADQGPTYSAWWPTRPDGDRPSADDPFDENMREPVTDRRDWVNQIHAGQRWIARGELHITTGETHE